MDNMYQNFQASLFRYCKEFADEMKDKGDADLQVFKFDAHADLNKVPEQDVIGLMEYAIETDDGTHVVTTMIALSTINDTNILRLDRLISTLYDRLQVGATIYVYDFETNVKVGMLKVMNGTAILPVLNTETRPVKAVAVLLGSGSSRAP